ncbi:hypothetical protein CE91St25_02020 [Campylobacter ureolyticus]|nr:hypothetical protein CE91St25_02020 [Campylobacter ureolyticus]
MPNDSFISSNLSSFIFFIEISATKIEGIDETAIIKGALKNIIERLMVVAVLKSETPKPSDKNMIKPIPKSIITFKKLLDRLP